MPTRQTPPTSGPSPRDRLLRKLRAGGGETSPSELWRRFEPSELPVLFPLLDIASRLPRLVGEDVLAELDAELWPELAAVASELVALQLLAENPVALPSDVAARCRTFAELEEAVRELREEHCTTIDFLFPEAARPRIEALVAGVAARRTESWGPLARDAEPELFALADQAVAGAPFRRLTGFDPERDEYTLTLSQQNLQPSGIGWHRDLYWPREWVGEDVFAALYGLTSDTPELGGAFLYWDPERGRVRSIYRQRHQATVIWNGRANSARPLHAVSGYLTEHTARHHLHLQCRRRSR